MIHPVANLGLQIPKTFGRDDIEMAILPFLPGIEATVCVNNVPLQEYFDEEPTETLGSHADRLGPKTVSKYIESNTDQEFTLHFRIAKPYKKASPSLRFVTLVDGSKVCSSLFRLSAHGLSTPLEKDAKGVKSYDAKDGRSTFQALKFSSISTSMDDDKLAKVNEDSKRMSKIGIINVKLYRESEPRLVPRKSWTTNFGTDAAPEVHEKALKGQAKSHGVSLGEAKLRNASAEVWSTSKLDGEDSPIANFIFKYRSKESLKQLHVIERTPEPDSFSQGSLLKVKRERADNDDGFVPKKRSRSSGEKIMIDLTTDSDNEGIMPRG